MFDWWIAWFGGGRERSSLINENKNSFFFSSHFIQRHEMWLKRRGGRQINLTNQPKQIKCLWFELDWWWIEWRCFYLCFIVHQPIIPFHFIIAFFSIRKGQPQPQQTSFLHPAHSEELEWKEKKCCWWRAASSSSAVHSKLSENLQFSSSLFISALRFARITVIILFYSFRQRRPTISFMKLSCCCLH